MSKVALITGVTGQDGAYLADYLLAKGYQVHGIKRRASSFNTQRIDHLYQDPFDKDVRFTLHYGDLSDSLSVVNLIQQIQPDEIYNLAAMSHVQVSFELPEYTANVDALGTLRVLEAVRLLGLEKKTKIYQASTSELYGKVQAVPQNEETPFYPRSPYGVAKLYGYWITINYREAYNMYACNGILFNHESPIRGKTFVTRKITRSVARIALGIDKMLYLGNLNAKRDWGHAKDYVRAMHLMLQQQKPKDYVIATGETRSVRDFVQQAFQEVGIRIDFKGKDVDERGIIAAIDENKFQQLIPVRPQHLKVGQPVIAVSDRYFRPTEVELLIGDPTKAKQELGWQPEFTFQSMVADMILVDIAEHQGGNLKEKIGLKADKTPAGSYC